MVTEHMYITIHAYVGGTLTYVCNPMSACVFNIANY